MRPYALVAATAMFAASLAAHADTTFAFSFGSSSDAFSGSGLFTASNTSTAGEYTITGVTGTVDTGNGVNRAIASLLAPGTFPTLTNGGYDTPNDNLLFDPAVDGGYFDYDGVAFELGNGAQINLFYQPNTPSDAFLLRAGGAPVFEDVTTSVTGGAAVTPEPGSILLLGTGLLALAGIGRRRMHI